MTRATQRLSSTLSHTLSSTLSKPGAYCAQVFAHEKLHFYTKALAFFANSTGFASGWNKKHAVVDHFTRAAESILLNLAEAARQHGAPGRLHVLDYALGSSLECAACLDIARIKEFLDDVL